MPIHYTLGSIAYGPMPQYTADTDWWNVPAELVLEAWKQVHPNHYFGSYTNNQILIAPDIGSHSLWHILIIRRSSISGWRVRDVRKVRGSLADVIDYAEITIGLRGLV